MKASFTKRLLSYILDILFLIIIICVMNLFIPADITSEINRLNSNYINNNIDLNSYIDSISILYQNQDKNQIFLFIVNIIYIIICFIIVPLKNDGSTFGQKILGIKVEASYNQKLTYKKLFVRSLILNGLVYLIVVILLLYIISPKIYFILTSIISFIQILLVIISGFMILYRKDKRAIYDILAQTKVVTTK